MKYRGDYFMKVGKVFQRSPRQRGMSDYLYINRTMFKFQRSPRLRDERTNPDVAVAAPKLQRSPPSPRR